MFSKSITNSSQYLMMPASSQNLYFHLSMNADDDGFCEHFSIMRMTDSKPDDLKILQAKGYVMVFDEKVLVITDWKENNYLRADRYSPSKYLKIYKAELAQLSSGIPEVDQCVTQDRIGKGRVGEGRIEIHMSEIHSDADHDGTFEQFWKAYPKKELKPKSRQIWKDKNLYEKLPEILAFVNGAKQTPRWKAGYIKQPTTFLRNECWTDDLAAYGGTTTAAPAHVYRTDRPDDYYDKKTRTI